MRIEIGQNHIQYAVAELSRFLVVMGENVPLERMPRSIEMIVGSDQVSLHLEWHGFGKIAIVGRKGEFVTHANLNVGIKITEANQLTDHVRLSGIEHVASLAWYELGQEG